MRAVRPATGFLAGIPTAVLALVCLVLGGAALAPALLVPLSRPYALRWSRAGVHRLVALERRRRLVFFGEHWPAPAAGSVGAARRSAAYLLARVGAGLLSGIVLGLLGVGLVLAVLVARGFLRGSLGGGVLAQAHQESQDALVELREVAWRAYPAALDDLGLAEALAAVAERAGIPVHLDLRVARPAPPPVETAAYFVVSEAVTNAVKHSRAARIDVAVTRHDAGVSVLVRDDGAGGADPAGGGLSGLGLRVAALDGTLRVRSPAGGADRDRSGDSVRLILAEDSALLREGLVRLLAEEGHEVLAAVGDGDSLLRQVELLGPDVIVVDVRMPPTHTDEGLRAACEVRRRWPAVGVLVLSQHVEKNYAAQLLASDSAGVGYLLKDRVSRVDEFLDSLERVHTGGAAIDPEVVRQLLARTSHGDPLARLTGREREVLEQMAQGHTNAAVAAKLHVSQSAVEKHVNMIFEKLDLNSTAGYSRRVLAVLRYLSS